ncbi:MAG: TPM domain-containing protein [Candidatus Aminicenantes bacterium]|nr:MAG: TPM domain-containing protein [Candidatus Aminicenantes bacterium]
MKAIVKKYILWTVVLVFFFSQPLAALKVPKKTGRRVNDFAGILTNSQETSLENLLRDTEQKTSSQVALLTIPSLEGEVLEEFSLKVTEEWELGQEEFDNGVLVLVAMGERKIRIEVGYGLEPILTDAKSNYIIRKMIVPEFKKRNYFAGINNGLKAVSGLIAKEFEITPQQLQKFQKEQRRAKGTHIPFGVIVFFIIIGLSVLKGFARGGMGRGSSAIFWGSAMGGSSYHRSGGGGFSGGGFSGGGGSFGGGGSSGGW